MKNIAKDAFFIEALAKKLNSRGLSDKQVVDEVHAQFPDYPRAQIEAHLKAKHLIS